ncbi:MAG: cytochrome P450 [Nannocystaceae bacterium]
MASLPPGPRSALWSMARYLRDPMGVMPALAREHGDPFTIPGEVPLVCAGTPAGIQAIYRADPEALTPLSDDLAFVLGESSLILIGGAAHRRRRKLMGPPFRGARMRSYGAAMRRIAAEHVAGWGRGATVDVYAAAQRISLAVILEVVFGVDDREGRGALGHLLLDYVERFSPLLALFPALRRPFAGVGPYAALLRRRAALHRRLDALIAAAREDPGREDILSLLVAARDEDGAPMTDEDIRAQLVLLVVAGHETTAISIAWALDALHRPENAAAYARLRDELDALGPAPEIADVAAQPYLGAACDEALRRFPLAPAPAPRRLLRPLELAGYALPAGVAVAAAIGVAHLDPRTYPDPLRFRPERFLERSFSPFEFLPFGGGARRCLGAALASYEMRIVVATILRAVDLRLASTRPLRVKLRAANVGPAAGVKMIVTSRR